MTAPDTVLTDLRSGAPDRVLAALDAYDDCAFDLEHLPYPGPDPAALGAWPAGPPNEVVRRFVRLWLDGDASIRWVAGVGFAAWPEPQRGWAAAVFALRDEPFPG
jgi:hypothetical protein